MASSLEELLAAEGFKGSRRRSTKSRSSFHYGASSEPLQYSLEERLCMSTERIKTQRPKSKTASRYHPISVENRRSKNDHETDEKNSSTSSEYISMPRYDQGSDSGRGVFEDVYSDHVSIVTRGKDKSVEKEKLKGNRKNIKPQEKSSYTRSNSNSNSNKNRHHHDMEMQVDQSSLAIDEVAVQALVSILNGSIKRFLNDEDFRSSLRHNCFSSLDFIQLEEENNSETKVITSLEQAIETIEQTAEELVPISAATYLKRTTMQLSIITGLSLNDLKYESTCGIPNYKLSACAHLYLSVVYMIQKKSKVSAKHLLQVFCDSPFQARTILLPKLWENLFSPQLCHLKTWYNKEAEILVDTSSKARKLRLLKKVYNEHLDSGTHLFAVYYKDWLTEGVESPSIPSIGIPSLSVTSHRGSSISIGHSSESFSSTEPFSPQPMVSKKLYDSFFSKSGAHEVEDDKDEDSLEYCLRGSYGSTIVKQTLIYESETVKYIDQSTGNFNPSVPVDAFTHKGALREAAEEWRKRNLGNVAKKSFSMETNLNSHRVDDALSHEKANGLSPTKTNMISSTLEGSNFPSIPQEFICPLTGNIIEEPVTLESGETFEREAIKEWFKKGNITCPVTGNTLDYVSMPFTNLILKRLIDNWKSEQFDRLLDFASQTVENAKELKLKRKDEPVVFKLQSLFSSLKEEEEKSTYAKHLISFGVLPLLFRRFELGNIEEKSYVLALLINFIQADSGCIYQIARSVDRKCLLEVLHNKEVTPMTNAILFLTELMSMKRRKDVTSFISGLVTEDIFSTMHILLMFLRISSPVEKP